MRTLGAHFFFLASISALDPRLTGGVVAVEVDELLVAAGRRSSRVFSPSLLSLGILHCVEVDLHAQGDDSSKPVVRW